MTETGTARWRRALSYSTMCLLVAAPQHTSAVIAIGVGTAPVPS